jgi:hypothetical protein
MVDSRTEREMEGLRNRVRRVEERLDLLAASLNTRFDGVDAAFVEQRQYTEFAFARLETKMDAGVALLKEFIDEQRRTNDLVERRLNPGDAGRL